MEYEDILDRMREVHEKKNHDYASDKDPFSNFLFAADFASDFTDNVDKTFATIIGIKLARLIALQGKEAVNESVLDTYQDLTIYMSLWYQWHCNFLIDESQTCLGFKIKTVRDMPKNEIQFQDSKDNILATIKLDK